MKPVYQPYFIQRGEVTELQIYYNRPPALDALKYTQFLEKYNTSSKNAFELEYDPRELLMKEKSAKLHTS